MSNLDSSGGRIAVSASWGILAQAVDKLLPVAVLLYLARTLEPGQFGSYTFIIAYLALFQSLSEYSIDTVTVRTMSELPGRTVEVFRAALGLKLAVALLLALVAVALVSPVSGGQASVVVMAVASLGLVTGMGGAYRSLFRSRLEIKRVFVMAAIRAVILSAAVVLAVRGTSGLTSLFVAIAVANALTFVVVAASVGRRDAAWPLVDVGLWSDLLRGAAPLALNTLSLTIGLRAGHLVLMAWHGPVEVGLLGAASRVAEAFTVLPEALMITVYPLMARLQQTDPGRLLGTAEKSTKLLIVVAGIPVLTSFIAGRQLMSFLYGPGFIEAGGLLSLLAVTALLGVTGTVIINLLITVGLERILYRNTAAFAAVNVALCLLLVPEYGYMGAAVAIVLSSVASQVCLCLLPSTRRYAAACLRSAFPAVLAMALSTVVVVVFVGQGWAAAAVSLAVYAVVLVLVGVVGLRELELARVFVSSFRPGDTGKQ